MYKRKAENLLAGITAVSITVFRCYFLRYCHNISYLLQKKLSIKETQTVCLKQCPNKIMKNFVVPQYTI